MKLYGLLITSDSEINVNTRILDDGKHDAWVFKKMICGERRKRIQRMISKHI